MMTEEMLVNEVDALKEKGFRESDEHGENVVAVKPAAMAEAEATGKSDVKADIMKRGLTEGCLGCRSFAEGNRAQGHSEGCRARLEAEIAKTDEGESA